jgi:hypothetical protein
MASALVKGAGVGKRILLLPCLLIFCGLAFAACGGGGSEEGEVEEVIETAAASSDPADCKRLQTLQFTEQASHETAAALVRCEEEAERDEGVEAATASDVQVDGSNATAKVTLRGGLLDGQTVEVSLVKSGDQWKLSEIVGFIKFDESKLIERLEGELEESSGKVSVKFASCFVESLKEGGQREVEELLLSPASEEVEGVARHCA